MKTFALVLALALAPSLARADDPAEAHRAQLRQQVRATIHQHLAAFAGLDAQASARVSAISDRYDDQIAKLQADARQAYVELMGQIQQPQPDVATINRLTDRILGNHERVQQLENDRAREVRRAVTPVQFAKMVIAFPKITHEVRANLRKALREQADNLDDEN